MEYTLRAADNNDIEFLIALRDTTLKGYLSDMGAGTDRKSYVERVLLHYDAAQIVEVNGQRAGLFKAIYRAEKNEWYVVQIQIHPDFQNGKIGSRLLKGLIEKAKLQGANVALGVLKTNPAQKLYKRLGFKVVGENEWEYEMLLTHD